MHGLDPDAVVTKRPHARTAANDDERGNRALLDGDPERIRELALDDDALDPGILRDLLRDLGGVDVEQRRPLLDGGELGNLGLAHVLRGRGVDAGDHEDRQLRQDEKHD